MTYSPFIVQGAERTGRWLITVDHATNHIPPDLNDGDLGLSREDMERHIAVSYTHLRAHETVLDLVCRLLLEKKKHIHSP